MVRKKRSKAKISVEVVLAIILIALIAAIICYFAVPSFKKMVDDYYKQLVQGNDPGTNAAKGESQLRVHYLDVGQGDSILIEFPDDTVMLIDSGDRKNATAEYIVEYLEKLEVEIIDYLMLTHSDEDHVGNMVQILEAFEVESAYVPDIDEGVITTNAYRNFITALNAETYTTESGASAECEINKSEMGDLIESENESDVFFMAFLSPSPRGMYEDGEYDELNSKKPSRDSVAKNAVSPITYLEYMGKRLLFTGDVTGEPTERVMERYETGVYRNLFAKKTGGYYSVSFEEGIDVYKAAHHGSMTHGSNAAEFIDFIAPKNAVICVGEGNTYNLPDSDLLEIFSEREIPVYRTDENGTIVVTISPSAGTTIYLTRQDETVTDSAESAAVAEGAAYLVSRRKIMVNCVSETRIA